MGSAAPTASLPIPPLSRARHRPHAARCRAAEAQALEAKLAAWEPRTGNQLAVLMVPTTQPEPIEAYSIRVADAWKIGRKGQDNGALLVVAKNDRKMRIEVGYGLEGVLTDATSRRIIVGYDRAAVSPGPVRARASTQASTASSRSSTKGEPLAAPKAKPAQRAWRRVRPRDAADPRCSSSFRCLAASCAASSARSAESTVGAGIVGAGAWFVAGSILIGVAAAVIAWIVLLMFGVAGGGIARGGGAAGHGAAAGGPVAGGGWRRRRRLLGRRRQLRRRRRVGQLVRATEERPCPGNDRIDSGVTSLTDDGDVRRAFPRRRHEARSSRRSPRASASIAGRCASRSRPRCRWRACCASVTPRERALEVFGLLRVWDTEENDGVLRLPAARRPRRRDRRRPRHSRAGRRRTRGKRSASAMEARVSRWPLRRRRRRRACARSTRCSPSTSRGGAGEPTSCPTGRSCCR